MENFASYILNKEDIAEKLEIAYYLSKKTNIYFGKAVVFKMELARIFIDFMKLDVDKNLVLTACILCNCKKVDDAQKQEKLYTYAKEGAEYLETLGFNSKFCKMCEEINRYSGSNPREKESDILELVDQFGGMLLDRPERKGLEVDEAMVLIEYRNLKNEYNRYLEIFRNFIEEFDKIEIKEMLSMKAIKRLVKIYRETKDVKEFIRILMTDFEPSVDKAIEEYRENLVKDMLKGNKKETIPLFTEETIHKVLGENKELEKI